ncbi:MAG: phosphatidate cytidylyltransferase [Brevinema sp.]
MTKRWISALIGIFITVGIWLISPLWQEIPTLLLAILAGSLINFELMMMSKDKENFYYPFFALGILLTISLLFTYLFGMGIISFSNFIVTHMIFFLLFFYSVLGRSLFKAYDFSEIFTHLGFYFLIYIILILLFPQLVLIKFREATSWMIVILFLFCWISDAFGLFTGMLFGKHPLKMLPSKSKTLEGYIGSFVFTVLLGVLFYYLQGILHLPFQWSFNKWVLFGFCMSLSSNFGDLVESLIKRWFDKKDSGTLLPGIGGLFDAIDGQIFAVPIALLFTYL